MQTEEPPDRRPEEPPTDHHFETPVVREARPARGTNDERDDEADTDGKRRHPQERKTDFQHRWENVQTAFVARSRRSPQVI